MSLADLKPRISVRYGWKPDTPDWRDAVMGVEPMTSRLPDSVDLSTTPHTPDPYSQLELGACTAHGIKYVVEFDNHLETGAFLDPSRLWIYYWERYIEGTIDQDSGAQIRDGIKVMAKVGAPPESEWPYDINTFATLPANAEQMAADAKKDQAIIYKRLPQTQWSIQHCLATLGRPFVFGFTVYESFESATVAKTGIADLPVQGESVLGGHCVAAVGYKMINGQLYVKCRNSWGKDWGEGGYFYLPMRYLITASLAQDFWVVQSTNAKAA